MISSPHHPPARARVAGAALAALGGVALAVQGRVNGQLGQLMDDGVFAALISFGVGAVLLAVAVSLTPSARAGLLRLRNSVRGGRLRVWQCLGGACGAWLVTTQGLTVSILGVAVFTVAVVAGQTVAGLVVDRRGVGPGEARPITLSRAAGAGIAVVAVVVAVSDRIALGGSGLWWAVLPAVAGVGLAWQLAVNGLVRVESANVVVPTLVNFGVGTVVLVLAAAVDLAVRGLPRPPPDDWWLYIGGVLGIVTVLTAVVAVRFTGVLLLGLGSVAGQLAGAVVLDLVAPTAGGLSTTSVVGAALTMVAVAVAAVRR
ncbi:DMT family transporter [Actinophytocola gossypii]|uniref:DMT family transporter n=1 Tax=Actinophytocola gossypii TaxID=2812003 RepID=UPI0021A33596|nr:DMT family transporter [Actinophytocola gossypii]